jgi:hypothetical protein
MAIDTNTITSAIANNQSIFGIDLKTILIILIGVTILKGFALWKAVEKRSKGWFWVLMFVNTLGILDALYLWVFSKRGKN